MSKCKSISFWKGKKTAEGQKWWEMKEEDKQVVGQWSAQKHPEWWMMMARHNRRHLSPSAELVCTICHIWGNLLQILKQASGTNMVMRSKLLETLCELLIHNYKQPWCFPHGLGRLIAPRPLCARADKRSLLFSQTPLELFARGYLWGRCAGKLWLCKPYSNREGITSVLPAPETRPTGPGGLFNTGSTAATHLYAAEWTEIRVVVVAVVMGGADQIWKCWGMCCSNTVKRWSRAVTDSRKTHTVKEESETGLKDDQKEKQPVLYLIRCIHLD